MLETVLLVVTLACGMAGLYLALPGGRRAIAWAGVLLLIGAGAALLALLIPLLTGAGAALTGWFVVLSLIGLYGALRMITHRLPVYSALYFILVVVSVAGMLLLLEATFTAAALLIIYAGAILVTYMFVIMLAQQSGAAAYDARAREPLLGCIAGFVLLAIITGRVFLTPAPEIEPSLAKGTTLNLGIMLMTEYVIALQLAGVLLLAAMVGAIAIARRRASGAAIGAEGTEGDVD